jgi:nucleoside-diphosphate-sugar epimerase
MRVIVAGGIGFVGKVLVADLIRNGHQVVLLLRPSLSNVTFNIPEIEYYPVDIENPLSTQKLRGDAIINLVGIIREYPSKGITFYKSHFLATKNLVDWAGQNGIKQYLQMSALGVKAGAQTGYEQTKYDAECYIRESSLDWTIFRPSIIVGPGGGLISLLSGMIRRLPVVPVIGHGRYKVQPIYVKDVTQGFVKALGNEQARGRVFEVGGPEVMTFDRMLDKIGKAMGHASVRKLHQPLWMLKPLASLLGQYKWFPLTIGQITMLAEENYSEDRSYFDFFGITPKTLEDALREFI